MRPKLFLFCVGLTFLSFSQERLIKGVIKENFHELLKRELDEDFFFKELKIPPEKYYHFLEYYNPLGIEKLYKEHEVLKLIKVLRKGSEA